MTPRLSGLRTALFTGAFTAALMTALMAPSPAAARNTRLLLPIEPVLKLATVRTLLGDDMHLQFGDKMPADAQVVQQEIRQYSKVDTHMGYAGTRPLTRTDEQACREAFRVALVDMVLAARKAGGTALVRVVSHYDNVEMASPAEYECHAGATRAVVELKAVIARWAPPAAQATSVAPTKRARAASGAASAASAAEAPRVHALPVPAASGYAATDDANAVPIRDEGKARYRHYLTLPSPKAFVVLENGGWYFQWRDANAMTKALDHCEKIKRRCWLYAVDDRVVWQADVDKRIGRSAQLRPTP